MVTVNAIASGLSAWLIQRISGAYIALFLVYALISLALYPPADYSQWLGWINHSYRHLFIALFFVAIMVHAWVGGRDVILDYIHPYMWRLMCLIALGGFLMWLLLWALRILFMVSLS